MREKVKNIKRVKEKRIENMTLLKIVG